MAKIVAVGVGPGAPDLMTLRAVEKIRSARVLAYTVDRRGESYARKTASGWIQPGTVEIPLFFSMAPDRTARLETRRDAARRLREALAEYPEIVLITEGDPLLYSACQHILSEISADCAVEICPGISAMNAAAGASVFPLAIEEEILTVAPAASALPYLTDWLEQGRTVVLYKAAKQIAAVRDRIAAAPVPIRAALIERCSDAGERILRDPNDWDETAGVYFTTLILKAARPETERPNEN